MFFEMAGHVIDMMIAMLGTPRQTTPFLAHHHREGPESFIDNGVAVFTYPNAWPASKCRPWRSPRILGASKCSAPKAPSSSPTWAAAT